MLFSSCIILVRPTSELFSHNKFSDISQPGEDRLAGRCPYSMSGAAADRRLVLSTEMAEQRSESVWTDWTERSCSACLLLMWLPSHCWPSHVTNFKYNSSA